MHYLSSFTLHKNIHVNPCVELCMIIIQGLVDLDLFYDKLRFGPKAFEW